MDLDVIVKETFDSSHSRCPPAKRFFNNQKIYAYEENNTNDTVLLRIHEFPRY